MNELPLTVRLARDARDAMWRRRDALIDHGLTNGALDNELYAEMAKAAEWLDLVYEVRWESWQDRLAVGCACAVIPGDNPRCQICGRDWMDDPVHYKMEAYA